MPAPSTLKLDQPPRETNWLIRDTLPRGELVFLDGPSGVGKSCLAAAFVAGISHSPVVREGESILYICSPRQRELIRTFLHRQQPNYDKLRDVEFLLNPANPDEPLRLLHLHQFLMEEIIKHNPALIVIDSFEEELELFPTRDTNDWTLFWDSIQRLATTFRCTILIPRKHGYHENRQYGPEIRTGSEIARFALTMLYHPTDPLKRVITVAKNQTGPIGGQSMASFVGNVMQLSHLEHHDHTRPSRSVVTWQPNEDALQENAEIIQLVEYMMGGEPMHKRMVKEGVLKSGYSERAYHRAMNQARLPSKKIGELWAYLPSPAMLLRAEEQLANPAQQPRAQGAAVDQKTPMITKPAPMKMEAERRNAG